MSGILLEFSAAEGSGSPLKAKRAKKSAYAALVGEGSDEGSDTDDANTFDDATEAQMAPALVVHRGKPLKARRKLKTGRTPGKKGGKASKAMGKAAGVEDARLPIRIHRTRSIAKIRK